MIHVHDYKEEVTTRQSGKELAGAALDVVFGRRQAVFLARIDGRRRIERAPESFEDGFDLMMSVVAVERDDVDINACLTRQRVQKVPYEIGFQISNCRSNEGVAHHEVGSPSAIDRHVRERLVHRHGHIGGAPDAAMIPKRLVDRLTETDCHVFDCVMCVDAEVSLGLDAEIEEPVAGKECQEVIERANAGRDLNLITAIDV